MRMLRLVALLWMVATPALAQELAAEAEFRTLWCRKSRCVISIRIGPRRKRRRLLSTDGRDSDPVGVPHPDEITVQITVRKKGPEFSPAFRLCVQVRWKEGPDSNSKRARWDMWRMLKTADIVAGRETERALSVPVNIQDE